MPNKFKSYSQDQMDELLSRFLIDSWSYSKVSTFARNEKAFEMQYIYGEKGKESASQVAGQAYHASLDFYFKEKRNGRIPDLITLEEIAFSHIQDKPANIWKIQKTNPTVEDCISTACKNVSIYIKNFLQEAGKYNDSIKEVLYSEFKIIDWICVNGVDIPMPCSMVLDLAFKSVDGKIIIADHKTKSKFTEEEEIGFVIGKQAITYVLGFEALTGLKVDEVWFVENKLSKNKDNSPQLVAIKKEIDNDTRRLYEALLYEPLKKMIEAVSNPDYVYMINDSDTLASKAEIYSFWIKTMIAEVDEFDISESKKPLIEARLRKIRDASMGNITPKIARNFKDYTEQFIPYDYSNKNMTQQQKIEHCLRSFGISTEIKHVFDGYSSASYLLEVAAGTPLTAINKYKLDIANALSVPNIRVYKDLVVYQDKAYVCIESGKRSGSILSWDKSKLIDHRIPLGVDNFGNTIFWDTNNASTPHKLVCGATGSGKSVFLRSDIEFALLAGFSEIIIMDPKHEFSSYANRGCTVHQEIEDIEKAMRGLVIEMNNRVKSGTTKKTLIVFDEFADAVANSASGKELNLYGEEITGYTKEGMPKTKRVIVGANKSLEENLRIILQKGRSLGFRVIAATQRASTKVITGDAKVNFPVQVCFRVPKEVDSMVVLDEPGAESLNGRGDGLIKSPDMLNTTRFQAFYI